MKSVFTNESGNVIQCEVADAPESRILIAIRGPHSESENIVTRMEAEKLRAALDAFLGQPKIKAIHDQWCDLRHDGYECNCTYGEPL